MWDRVYPKWATETWRSVSGPVGALTLTLRRIGWTMRDFATFTDHQGTNYVLTTTPPAMIRIFLHKAMLRRLEVGMGSKLGAKRVSLDPALAVIRKKSLTLLERGQVKVFVCDGSWTRERAILCNYKI